MKVTDTTDSQSLQQAFLSEFQEMLKRYNAEFEIVDTGTEYYPNYVPVVAFNSIYGPDGNAVREYNELVMPDRIS